MRRLLFLLLPLAVPAFGQPEKLIGTWELLPSPEEQEAGMVLHLEFRAGGQFEVRGESVSSAEQLFADEEGEPAGKLLRAAGLAQADSSDQELPDFEIGDEVLAELLAGIFPDTLTVAVSITGTWEADETRLRLDGQTSQMRVNGLEPAAFFEQMARDLAKEMAEALEIPAEDYPAFEAEIVAGFSEGAEGNLLEGEFGPDDLDTEGTYAIEEGVLTITDAEGELTRFQQVTISAVEALSWGQLKRAGR